tara:strand:- start:108 stop:269 length:162 start_codon:yes stop_codon:yes gene_type:complete
MKILLTLEGKRDFNKYYYINSDEDVLSTLRFKDTVFSYCKENLSRRYLINVKQ